MFTKELTTDICIPPNHLETYKKYIMYKLREQEHSCSKHGYIFKILKITKIEFKQLYVTDFTGSIVVSVKFKVDYMKPEVNDVLDMTLISVGEIAIASTGNGIILCIISNDSNLKLGDAIKVKIMKVKFIQGCDKIKIVGEYLEQI